MLIQKIDRFFKITESNSTFKREITAGLITFLTMSYIIFVNPDILSKSGMDRDSVFIATILSIVFATLLMGLYANWPIVLAPGMGTNVWFTYGIVLGMGYSWQVALGAIFISGIMMVILTILPIRKAIIDSIPSSLKMGLAAGIGLFILLLGLKSSGIIVAHPVTLLSLGDLTKPATYLSILGIAIIICCEAFKIRASIVISIFIISIISLFMGLSSYSGVISMPPSIAPTFLELDIKGAINVGFISIIITFFIIDFFNSTAVFIGIMGSVQNKIPNKNIKQALLVDGVGSIVGSSLGVNTVVAFTESASGVLQGGGRTGLVAVTIAVLFLIALFFSPLLTMIPSFASSPAMVYVACLLFKNIKSIQWDDITELFPAFLTITIIPLTFSILNGIGIGAIAWIIGKIVYRKWEMKYCPLLIIVIAFIANIIL